MPIRHPVIYAKEATSLAVITGNRFVLGVGTSPWPDDYEIVQLPWEGRGRRFDECIEIVRGLAAGGYFEYHGEFYDFPAIKMEPVPTQPIPVLIGGHADANLRRAARLGDGWMGAGGMLDDLIPMIDRMNDLRREHGRERERFDIYATTPESFTVDGIKQLEDLGVTHTAGGFGASTPTASRPTPSRCRRRSTTSAATATRSSPPFADRRRARTVIGDSDPVPATEPGGATWTSPSPTEHAMLAPPSATSPPSFGHEYFARTCARRRAGRRAVAGARRPRVPLGAPPRGVRRWRRWDERARSW